MQHSESLEVAISRRYSQAWEGTGGHLLSEQKHLAADTGLAWHGHVWPPAAEKCQEMPRITS